MTKFFTRTALTGLVIATTAGLAGACYAQDFDPRQAARIEAARAAQIRAAKAQKMEMIAAQRAQAAQASMAMATVTAATLQATDAGECSPYLAKWMMTKNIAAKMAYEACMDD